VPQTDRGQVLLQRGHHLCVIHFHQSDTWPALVCSSQCIVYMTVKHVFQSIYRNNSYVTFVEALCWVVSNSRAFLFYRANALSVKSTARHGTAETSNIRFTASHILQTVNNTQ